jgi:hypothetical protein
MTNITGDDVSAKMAIYVKLRLTQTYYKWPESWHPEQRGHNLEAVCL